MLNWVINHTEYSLRTPARRCAKEFAALFKRRYTLKYGEGMVVKANKNALRLDYNTPAKVLVCEVFDFLFPTCLIQVR